MPRISDNCLQKYAFISNHPSVNQYISIMQPKLNKKILPCSKISQFRQFDYTISPLFFNVALSSYSAFRLLSRRVLGLIVSEPLRVFSPFFSIFSFFLCNFVAEIINNPKK